MNVDDASRGRMGVGGWLVRIVFACIGLGVLYFGADTQYKYYVGTPTTVTVTHCSSQPRGKSCQGTWTINGVPQTGYIWSGFHIPGPGSTLDAHVLGNMAYTSTVGFGPLLVGGVLTAGVAVSFLRRGGRRGQQASWLPPAGSEGHSG